MQKTSTLKESVGIITPYKYNGGQLSTTGKKSNKIGILENSSKEYNSGKNMSICVDLFEINFTGLIESNLREVIQVSDEIYLTIDEVRRNGTKHYKEAYSLYLHGEHFGDIKFNPRSSVLNPYSISFRVQNHILYQKGWVARLEFIVDTMKLVFNNVTRLDIAVDGCNRILSDYKLMVSDNYEKVGRAKHRAEYSAKNIVEGFYIGKKGSSKYIRGYNKTKELKEHSNKTYIKEFWLKNGLCQSEDIERIELSMGSKNFKYINDFDWGRLEETDYLSGLMKSQLKRFYEFALPGEKKVTRRERVEAVDWDYFNAVEVERLPKTKKANVTWGAKQSIAFDMRESFAGVQTGVKNLWDQAFTKCLDKAEKYNIQEWFFKKIPDWKKEKDIQLEFIALVKKSSYRHHSEKLTLRY